MRCLISALEQGLFCRTCRIKSESMERLLVWIFLLECYRKREKTCALMNILLVEADVARLPFEADSFDAVTCSYAFYELKGTTRDRALREIVRVLKADGVFLMMEHEVPSRPAIRILFYLRLLLAGSGHAVAFLRLEATLLVDFFATVEKVVAPGGRSKVLICRKEAA